MKIRIVVLILWTLLLFGMLWLPFRESLIPEFGGFKHWDKIVHLCLFAVTGFISVYSAGFFSRFGARVLFGLILGLVLASGTEFGQSLLPFRDPDVYDFLADLAGLFLGLLFFTLLHLRATLRLKLRL